jgi:Protein of unknown function (DUF4058)
MPSPFPGMDPYLENPELWSEVHSRLIVAIADAIGFPLRPKYQVAIEKRTYLSGIEDSVLVGIPDTTVFTQRSVSHPASNQPSATAMLPMRQPKKVTVPLAEEVNERYLEIREGSTGEVITVLEVLSPKNKRTGEGRQTYERKRQTVLASVTHLVEIDLLRGGKPMPILGDEPEADYRILISRGDRRPVADLYAFSICEPIPSFSLPLKLGDTEPMVDLQSILAGVYDRAGFDFRIHYTQPLAPGLSDTDAAWVDELLKEKGLRAS